MFRRREHRRKLVSTTSVAMVMLLGALLVTAYNCYFLQGARALTATVIRVEARQTQRTATTRTETRGYTIIAQMHRSQQGPAQVQIALNFPLNLFRPAYRSGDTIAVLYNPSMQKLPGISAAGIGIGAPVWLNSFVNLWGLTIALLVLSGLLMLIAPLMSTMVVWQR